MVSAAARIADGQLELWGLPIRIDLRRPDWLSDPLADSALPDGSDRSWPGDRKPLWELHRQQHIVPLGAGAALAGRNDWARLAGEHLLDWTVRNPPARGPGWSSGYETAHRLVGWTFAMPLVQSALEPSELARLDEAFTRQCDFLAARPSRFSSANNHRIAELVGLLAAARLDAAGLEWAPLWRELEQQVDRQTYADGGSREQAGGYFLYVLELLGVAAILARSAEKPLGRLKPRLEAMLEWLAAVANDEGEPPPVGDDAEDRMLRLEYFEPRRASVISARVHALVGSADRPRYDRSTIRRESGYAILRARGTRIVFDVGELGFGSLAAHGHADALAVLVDSAGESLLRDSGTGTYAPGLVREYLRSTAAHNTVVVDDASQAQSRGPHLWGHRFRTILEASRLSEAFDVVRASHDGYRGSRHTRSVVFVKPDVLVILDRIVSDVPREATLVWHTSAEPAIAVASAPDAVRLAGRGPCSPRYSSVEEAPRVTWTTRGERVVFATAVSLAGLPVTITLSTVGETVTVEVTQPKRIRIVERWRGETAEVEV
ncbi:MAG: alginate lyase family protein [Gaiellaceae bacterium]